MPTNTQKLPVFEGFASLPDLRRMGYSRRKLKSLLAAGILERCAQGIYRHTEAPPGDFADFDLAATLYPQAVISVVSALDYYGLTEHIPHEVDLVVPTGTRVYCPRYPLLRLFRTHAQRMLQGTCSLSVSAHRSVTVADPSRALIDAYRFRNRCGTDVFLDALKRYAASEHYRPALLYDYAKTFGVLTSFLPYLNTIA